MAALKGVLAYIRPWKLCRDPVVGDSSKINILLLLGCHKPFIKHSNVWMYELKSSLEAKFNVCDCGLV